MSGTFYDGYQKHYARQFSQSCGLCLACGAKPHADITLRLCVACKAKNTTAERADAEGRDDG